MSAYRGHFRILSITSAFVAILSSGTIQDLAGDSIESRLASADPSVRAIAEGDLLSHVNPLPMCLNLAQSETLARRFAAVRTIRKLIHRGHRLTLTEEQRRILKTSEQPEVQALHYLLLPHDAEGIRKLLVGAKNPIREVRLESLHRLSAVPVAYSSEPLIHTISTLHSDAVMLTATLSALSAATPSESAEVVIRYLSDSRDAVVEAAAKLLGTWKSTDAAAALLATGINSRSESVRVACFRSLAQLGEHGTSKLKSMAGSDQGHVREQAANAFGYIAGSEPVLLQMLETDTYARVAQAASRSLQRLCGTSADNYFYPYDAPRDRRNKVVGAWKSFLSKERD